MLVRSDSPTGLNLRDVAFHYPDFELAPVSLETAPGEILALIGPNGSGKSTLLEITSGHLKPTGGAVLLDGVDVHTLTSLERARRVALARQDTPLLFPFTVREFVRQGRHAHVVRLFETMEDEGRVDQVLQQSKLEALADRLLTEISGGEFQRAVLARALAQQPRLLLLDEPTANLDIGFQIEMLALLRRLAAGEDIVVVLVTHELNLASEMADRIVLVEGGRAILQGPPEAVFEASLLSRVFRTPVAIDRNPSSGRPRATWITPREDTSTNMRVKAAPGLRAK